MKNRKAALYSASLIATAVLSAACSPGAQYSLPSQGRIQNLHEEMVIVPPDTTSQSVSAQAVTIGQIFLESQIAPQVVGGTQLQASDLQFNGIDGYISYNAVDNGTTVVKKGAVEHFQPSICDNPLTIGIEFCLTPKKTLPIPDADIFSSFSDGSNLYAVGSTLDESALPHFGRLYKIGLDASKDPTLISASAVVPSYAGTSVIVRGNKVLTTSGMRTDTTTVVNGMPVGGGLSFYNTSDLGYLSTFPLYDARAVSYYSGDSTSVYVTRAQGSGVLASSIVKYNADGSGTAGTSMVINGNTIAESKSDLAVGNSLIIASAGDGGFKIVCKANGTVVKTVPAVTVAGIPASRTVTNSVAAVPGYIFSANGEGGLYVYTFQKTSLLTSPCTSVNVTLVGRLSLGASTSYVNAEMSANSVRTVSVANPLGINPAAIRFIMVASGNKGVSMINISAISLGLLDVDDFGN